MSNSTFFAQLADLRKKFPFVATVGIGNENCDYTDNAFQSKDCYHVFEAFRNDGCAYCDDHGGSAVRDYDCIFGVNCTENCECSDYIDSSNNYYSQSFARCYNLWYCWYCVDCHDCFGCANLHNKQFCIYNVQYTEAEYTEKFRELKKLPANEVLAQRAEVIKKLPQLHSEHFDNVNSEYCDYAYYVTNCYYCFDCARDQDCGYLTASYDCKDCWDGSYIVRNELTAECSHSGDLYNCYQCTDCDHCFDSYYLEDCTNCHNCFGCTKLSHKQYCILNVQYTKEEYEAKVAALKAELGLKYASSATPVA